MKAKLHPLISSLHHKHYRLLQRPNPFHTITTTANPYRRDNNQPRIATHSLVFKCFNHHLLAYHTIIQQLQQYYCTTINKTTTTVMKNGTFTKNNEDKDDQHEKQKQNNGYRIHIDLDIGFVRLESYINSKSHSTTTIHKLSSSDTNKFTKNSTTVSNNATTTTKEEEEEESIPATVLQYERQLRKVKAFQRATKPKSIQNIQQHVLYIDEHMIVVSKPSGLLSTPGLHSNPSLLHYIYDHYPPFLNEEEGEKTPKKQKMTMEQMVVHRLDMDTSGILLFARNLVAMKFFQRLFQSKSIQSGKNNNKKVNKQATHHYPDDDVLMKTYEALLVGHLHESITNGKIHLPLQRDHRNPPFMRIATDESEHNAKIVVQDLQTVGYKKLIMKKPKDSITLFRIIDREWYNSKTNTIRKEACPDTTTNEKTVEEEETRKDYDDDTNIQRKDCRRFPVTRVELIPITGRTHQLRVHCAAMGHPIVADPAYGIMGEASIHGGITLNRIQDDSGFLTSKPTLKLQQELNTIVNENGGLNMCLHARDLKVLHPVSKSQMSFTSPPPF